jgi:squalene-hopene/tetraprenyl-beta-curcumene cyclase
MTIVCRPYSAPRVSVRPARAIVCALSIVLAGGSTVAASAEDATAPPAAQGPTAAAPAPETGLDPALQGSVQDAVNAGLHYLRGTQAEDGSWSESVGVTALGLRAFLESYRGYNESDGAFITRPIKFLLDHVNPDGSISETNQNRNYNTAVAITALEATGNSAYDQTIANAQQFLKGLQIDEQEGYEPSHAYYGGIGYGGDERPDLSNIYMAVEALHATDFDRNDPLWEKALTFVSRCQNNSETNDQSWAADDGGFAYMPGMSPHGGSVSYGGMTSAGLLSLLFAGADKDDPRVQAAYDWLRANYTVEENPGAKQGQGLFYYYNVFAKTLYAYGEPTLTDTQGVSHNWRNDLAGKLVNLKRPDGSWVNTQSPRWWEGDPNLVTAWSVIALNQVLRKE